MIIFGCLLHRRSLFLAKGVGDGSQRLQNAPVGLEVIKLGTSRRAVNMEPLCLFLVFHAGLAKICVEIVVGKAVKGAVIKDSGALPLQPCFRIGGMGLLLDAGLDVLVLGIADFRPAFVGGDLRRGVGINHGVCLLCGIQFDTHYTISFT